MREPAEGGLTPLEILVVVTIIALVLSFVASGLFQQTEGVKRMTAAGQLQKIEDALDIYRLQSGRYPTGEQGLRALVREPTVEPRPSRYPPSGYLKEKQLLDPWQRPFQYEVPGRRNTFSFDLFSFGRDGKEGGQAEDADIVNWDAVSAGSPS